MIHCPPFSLLVQDQLIEMDVMPIIIFPSSFLQAAGKFKAMFLMEVNAYFIASRDGCDDCMEPFFLCEADQFLHQ